MPQPEGSQLTHSISPLLTTIALGSIPSIMGPTSAGGLGLIAKRVFPNLPVAAPSGTYNIWKRGDFLRREMKKLANFEAPPIIGLSTTTGNFSVSRYGVSTLWTAMDLANARIGGMTDTAFINAKNLLVTTNALLELEIQTAALIQTAGNWTTTYAGVASGPSASQFIAWDQAASAPVDDVILWKEAARLLTGFVANTMILPIQVYNALRKNASLIDRIKYGGTMDRPTTVTLQQMIGLFELDIIIPEAVYNTAKEGQADSFTYIWNKNVWIGYVAPNPSRDTPSAGYHFSWTGDTTAGLPNGVPAGRGPNNFGSAMNDQGLFIKRYFTDRPSAEWVDCEIFTTPNITAADMGIVLTAVIT